MTKTFVLTSSGPQNDYRFEGGLALCENFVHKQIGKSPRMIAVTVSNHRFFRSKRVYVKGIHHMYSWRSSNNTHLCDGGVFSNTMDMLFNMGFIERGKGYQAIYFGITPLTKE